MAQILSFVAMCFIWGTIYPLLYIILGLVGLITYWTECFEVSKAVFLKKNEDLSFDEHTGVITLAFKLIYTLKILLCVIVFALIQGRTHVSDPGLLVNLELGFANGFSTYGIFVGQFLAVSFLYMILQISAI
jgi:hypothetical protein